MHRDDDMIAVGNKRALMVLLVGLVVPFFGNATQRAQPQLCGPALDRPFREALASVFDPVRRRYVTTYWVRETYRAAEFTTVVHRTTQVSSLWSAPVKSDALDRFLAEVTPLVGLANGKFEERRGWNEKFSVKNLKVAREYLRESSYVVVLDPAGRVIGGIRNIQMRDEIGRRLPEEDFLKIDVPPMGLSRTVPGEAPWKNEIGTFVIDERLPAELRRKITLELWSHLFRMLFSKGSVRANFYDQAFHTYGNRESLLMYKPMGFEKLRIYQHEGRWLNYSGMKEKDIPPIMIDGEPWWPLVLLPEQAKALNAKFTLGARSNVSPEWLQDRRRQLSEPEVSVLQMGALFPHLMEDLKSKDEKTFLAALTGLAEVIESAAGHMDVALAASRDRGLGDTAIKNVVEIRENLTELVLSLKARLATMTPDQKYSLSLFFGHVLTLKDRASDFLYTWGFFRDGVFPLVADDSLEASEMMMRYMVEARTPKQWIEQTGLVLDLGMKADGPEFRRDVLAASAELPAKLKKRGYTETKIAEVTRVVQAALFTPPTLHGSYQTSYSHTYPQAALAIVTLRYLPGRNADVVAEFVQLAAVRQYLGQR